MTQEHNLTATEWVAAQLKQSEQTSRTRFKIDHCGDKRIAEMLLYCYKYETEKRRILFQDSEVLREKISKTAKWLCGDCKTGLLLYGNIGSGKTTLAGAIGTLVYAIYGKLALQERIVLRKTSALSLSEMAVTDQGKYKSICNSPLLFIDDIGVEPTSIKSWGNEHSPVVELLYTRYDKQLSTIITSNLDDKGFADRYGERVADRIIEEYDKIAFKNASYRK